MERGGWQQLLRNHVDWMLQRLDHEDFKDQEGNDDVGKIKKFIYTSLQSKSLLGIVMGSDTKLIINVNASLTAMGIPPFFGEVADRPYKPFYVPNLLSLIYQMYFK